VPTLGEGEAEAPERTLAGFGQQEQHQGHGQQRKEDPQQLVHQVEHRVLVQDRVQRGCLPGERALGRLFQELDDGVHA
jgi:hypothetical protein